MNSRMMAGTVMQQKKNPQQSSSLSLQTAGICSFESRLQYLTLVTVISLS
jgi:hypothetical protein